MIRRWTKTVVVVIAVLSFSSLKAQAQFGNLSSIPGLGTGTGGTAASSGSTSGQSGTNQATGGQTSATQSGGDAAATGTASSQQVLAGSDRFLQRNQNPGQVIGADRAGVGNLLGTDQTTGQNGTNRGQQGQNRFGAGGFGAFGNQFGGNSLDSLAAYGALNSIANRRAQLRMPVQLDRNLTLAGVVAPQIRVTNITTRMSRIQRLQQMGSMTVAMDGRTAVVSGSVATAEDRELVAKMLLLEPGVADVKNELAVLSPEPAALDLSPAEPPPPPLAQPPLPPLPVLPTE